MRLASFGRRGFSRMQIVQHQFSTQRIDPGDPDDNRLIEDGIGHTAQRSADGKGCKLGAATVAKGSRIQRTV